MKKTLALMLILTTILSLIIITAVKTNSTPTYDPWADLNDDGKIDMKDIAATAKLFGAAGDPTKNVTVTNWPTSRDQCVRYLGQLNMTPYPGPWGEDATVFLINGTCDGYSRMTLYINVISTPNNASAYSHSYIVANMTWWYILPSASYNKNSYMESGAISKTEGTYAPYWQLNTSTIETKGPCFTILVCLPCDFPSWVVCDFYVYLRNA